MKLTELEGAALGLIWRRGSTTAYGLRKLIAESPTPHWSASNGTVYPLVERLCQAGLLSYSSMSDGRGTRELRVTPTGKKAFKRWMLDSSPAVVGPPPDPVRTRLHFLCLLSPSEESPLLEELEKGMKSQLARLKRAKASIDSSTWSAACVMQEKRIEWVSSSRRSAKR